MMRYVVGGLTSGTATWFSLAAPTKCADCEREFQAHTVMLHLKHDGGPPEALCKLCTAQSLREGILAVDHFCAPPPPEGSRP